MKKFILGILASIWLGFWTIFAQNIPDSAEISVKDPIIVWEAINLKVTVMKNWSKMNSYNGTIIIQITEEDWTTNLKDSDAVLPSNSVYTFSSSDLWEKEFQKWLEIKKEGTFYIEVSELFDDEKILWKQIIHVTQNNTNNIRNIDISYPTPNAVLWDKLEIIATASEIPNSKAIIYIDWKETASANVWSNWSINYTIWNITQWSHTLSIEIPDINWNAIWKSNTIYFSASPNGDNGIKNVIIQPENWLTVGDVPTVTVNTDEMIESVKMMISDRPDSESIIMNKVWIGQFVWNFFLTDAWEIKLSFTTSSSNNTINKSYPNYKSITVSDSPSVENIQVNTDVETKTADISREISDKSIMASYLIDWRVEWSKSLSWQDRTESPNFKFRDVPYDTVINLNITPYRNKQTNHWAASKTIQFVISKTQTCWNWTCDNWESYELCPQDCQWTWWTTIILWPSCPAQTVSIHTEKIWNSYYLIRDKAENVKKYIIYSSSSPDWKDKVKVYETTDTSYEYPFDHTSKEDIFMYFRVVWICDDWEEIELTWATKVKVWPTENFFLLICLTFLIYFWIKLFRHTEE